MFDCRRRIAGQKEVKYLVVADCAESAISFREYMNLDARLCAYVGSADQLKTERRETVILLEGWTSRADQDDIFFELQQLVYGETLVLSGREFIERMN
jgi:hypothetical protein